MKLVRWDVEGFGDGVNTSVDLRSRAYPKGIAIWCNPQFKSSKSLSACLNELQKYLKYQKSPPSVSKCEVNWWKPSSPWRTFFTACQVSVKTRQPPEQRPSRSRSTMSAALSAEPSPDVAGFIECSFISGLNGFIDRCNYTKELLMRDLLLSSWLQYNTPSKL